MQFRVPQNIDLEDKIIGPLTLKQFIILLIGGMFDYLWYTFFDTTLFILFAIPTTLLTLALVFAKVHEEPFPKFLGSLILFVINPKILTWGETPKPKIIEKKKVKKEKIIPKLTTRSNIERLSQIIDTRGWSGTGVKKEIKPKIPAAPPLAPVAKFKKRPRSLIEQVIKKKPPVTKAPQPVKVRAVQPKISQPQPIKTPIIQRPAPYAKPSQPIIKVSEVKKIVQEIGREEKTPPKKVKKVFREITKKLKSTPPEKIKSREPFWGKIIDRLSKISKTKKPARPRPMKKLAPAPTKEYILTTEIITPEDIEREFGLGKRVKSHEAIKPKLNLGPAHNVAEDPFDKVEP